MSLSRFLLVWERKRKGFPFFFFLCWGQDKFNLTTPSNETAYKFSISLPAVVLHFFVSRVVIILKPNLINSTEQHP